MSLEGCGTDVQSCPDLAPAQPLHQRLHPFSDSTPALQLKLLVVKLATKRIFSLCFTRGLPQFLILPLGSFEGDHGDAEVLLHGGHHAQTQTSARLPRGLLRGNFIWEQQLLQLAV